MTVLPISHGHEKTGALARPVFHCRRQLNTSVGLAESGLDQFQRRVEGRARAHDGFELLDVGQVIAADVDMLALDRVEFGDDLGLVLGQRLGQRGELGCQLGVLGLSGQFLGPVQRR